MRPAAARRPDTRAKVSLAPTEQNVETVNLLSGEEQGLLGVTVTCVNAFLGGCAGSFESADTYAACAPIRIGKLMGLSGYEPPQQV